MANAHDSRVAEGTAGWTEKSPSAIFLKPGITFVNLTDETLGVGCIPLLMLGDSVGNLCTQLGASTAENITRAVGQGKGKFEWVPSRSESTIQESAVGASWVLLVCRRTPNSMVEVLEVHRAEYPQAWQFAGLPGILATQRPPIARVMLAHDNVVGLAAAVMPPLVEALVQTDANTM